MVQEDTIWSLVVRVNDVDIERVDAEMGKFAFFKNRIAYDSKYNFLETGIGAIISNFETNCLGLVSTFFAGVGIELISPKFGFFYPCPYKEHAEREVPSPGHLAKVLISENPRYPYTPKDKVEAIYWSTVTKVCDEG